MAQDPNPLSRWSRLKQESRRLEEEKAQAKAVPAPAQDADKQDEAPALPALDQLTPKSDFTAFMHPKVQDSVRRVALKKLFADPHFNVPDLNEAYSGDWTGGEPITPEMLKQLNQAYTLLFSDEEKKALDEERARLAEAATPDNAQAAAQPPQDPTQEAKPDEPGRQDT